MSEKLGLISKGRMSTSRIAEMLNGLEHGGCKSFFNILGFITVTLVLREHFCFPFTKRLFCFFWFFFLFSVKVAEISLLVRAPIGANTRNSQSATEDKIQLTQLERNTICMNP